MILIIYAHPYANFSHANRFMLEQASSLPEVKIHSLYDNYPDHIEILRKLGMQVYYGDATRPDLLESAGAHKARLLINAIDDPDNSLALTEMVNDNFPHLLQLARARDVEHYVALRRAGIEHPQREVFESALSIGRDALKALGVGAYEAKEMSDHFRRYNTQILEELSQDDSLTTRAEMLKKGHHLISDMITDDKRHLSSVRLHGWKGTDEGLHNGTSETGSR